MTIRSTTAHFRFSHPFRLSGHGEELPAGAYDVLIEDEVILGLSFEALRRVSTFLRVEVRPGVTELRATSEQDILAALYRDRAALGRAPAAAAQTVGSLA